MVEDNKYIYIFTFTSERFFTTSGRYFAPKLNVEKVKVKETQKQYRCVEQGKAPFRYSKQVNKSDVGDKAFRSYSDIYYYSLDSNIEVFKEKITELLTSEINKHKNKILELQNVQEEANQIIKEQYNV